MTRPSLKSPRRRKISAALAGALFSGSGLVGGCAAKSSKARLPEVPDFQGRVLKRGDDHYERWRQSMVWQMRKPDRYPELILRPQRVEDIAAAVRFASQRGLKVAVKSGGHDVWCKFLRDGGVLVDLSQFNQYDVAQNAATVRVGPALWARDLMAALAPAQRGFPVAHCATVPMGGYLLGGGMGINGDAWDGIASFGIVSATVVTATGEILQVNERNHDDLYWALRGGSNRFPGIVADFELKTYRRSTGLYSSTFAFPLAAVEQALSLLEAARQANMPQTELLGLMLHAPGTPLDIGNPASKVIVVRAQLYTDDEAQAKRWLMPMLTHSSVKASAMQIPLRAETYESLFVDSVDWRRGFGFGRFAVDNIWANDASATVSAIAEKFTQTPSWKSHVVIQPKRSNLPLAGSGAFSRMDNTYVAAYSVWDDAEFDAPNAAWLEAMSTAMKPHATGRYVNETPIRSRPENLTSCYSSSAWSRLTKLKKQNDPDGVFFDFPKFA